MTATILLAEDDADQREEMYESLTNAGFSVIVAVDGPQALEQMRTFSPAVALLDVNMPGWNGIEVSSAANNLDNHCTIILMTADDRALRDAIVSECGAEGVFFKPVQLKKLFDFLETVIGRTQLMNLRAG